MGGASVYVCVAPTLTSYTSWAENNPEIAAKSFGTPARVHPLSAAVPNLWLTGGALILRSLRGSIPNVQTQRRRPGSSIRVPSYLQPPTVASQSETAFPIMVTSSTLSAPEQGNQITRNVMILID